MPGIEDRIKAAEERAAAAAKKLQQLKARKDALEARKLSRVLKGQRAEDTRRKILIGALFLDKIERGEWSRDKLIPLLDAYLTREDDRALFDLPPRPAAGVASHQAAAPQAEAA